ncbi:hypothetical protein RJ53_01860 [Methanocalculus chunghsingensis]|uniref:Beta propeller domain protein n=1 Tax=Methanocalculus chunghsingensis TaxID=156457 RepID=A0A8J8B664_9EURY|nr:beta-propeller domain-containing protein [Methanocalculus chunghsingensis]MBR1368307.1 hypothetical protein [Methanocalculus chunghsingensis]
MNRHIIGALLVGGLIVALFIGAGLYNDPASESADGPIPFASADEVREFLHTAEWESATGWNDGLRIFPGAMTKDAVAIAPPMPSPQSIGGTGASPEYSTTNIQVEGVDEADFVKNDGRHIYIIAGGRFIIVDAYPPENARIISNTTLSGTPREMYLAGSSIAIISEITEESFVTVEGSAAPVPVYRQVTAVAVYDCADRSRPHLIREVSASGSYTSSRMTDGVIYLVSQEYPQRRGPDIPLPIVRDGDRIYDPEIWRFDDLPGPFVFQTITALRPTATAAVRSESYLVGYGTTIYATQENLYITYTHYGGQPYGTTGPSTIIHRFELRKGDPIWRQTMSVPGMMLNQFSMDEYRDHLRVATTVEEYGREGTQTSSRITIFDRSGIVTGEITGIAPTERIFAARFIGDRCYLVTFRQIDPFFVIDLSNPKNPAILGELKIPGYSDYLHPYDANHIIGIGKDTKETAWGGFATTGVKIALFDVSDVTKPDLLDSITLGGEGSDSEVLRDHKAFYFNRKIGLMALPITVADGYGREYVWQGTYLYTISAESGFTLHGTIPQYAGDAPPEPGYWPTAVRRSLSIGDTIATVSDTSIVLTDLRDTKKRYAEILLPAGDRWGYGSWHPPLPAF